MPKRNLDRIRDIIIQIVEMDSPYDDGLLNFGDEMQEGDAYQLYLMEGAGLIEGQACREGLFFITNAGQDFYDAVLAEGVWQKAKSAVAETGGSATIEIIKELAIGFMKQKLEKHTGVQF